MAIAITAGDCKTFAPGPMPVVDEPPTGKPSIAEVVERLDLLGSPDAIADFFRSIDVKGIPHVPGDCPIARYISAETGKGVSAAGQSIGYGLAFYANEYDVNLSEFHRGRYGDAVKTPENLAKFMRNFDENRYADLKAGECPGCGGTNDHVPF